MTKLKPYSKVAGFSARKIETAYIDSGATHHFFSGERIQLIDVENASGMSKLVGKGIVTLPVDQELKIEAYHAPEFESNIVSSPLLSKTYDVTSQSILDHTTPASSSSRELMKSLQNIPWRIRCIPCLSRLSQASTKISHLKPRISTTTSTNVIVRFLVHTLNAITNYHTCSRKCRFSNEPP